MIEPVSTSIAPGVTVMTVNVGNGLAPDDQVLGALRESDADIIGIEELNRRQALIVEEGLADAYPYSAFFGDSYEGRGLLSRFPIRSADLVHIIADRPDVLAVVDIGPLLLTVIVGHPRPQELKGGRVKFRTASLRQILQLGRLAQQEFPAVLVGDFNIEPPASGVRAVREAGVDGCVRGGRNRARVDVPDPAGDSRGRSFAEADRAGVSGEAVRSYLAHARPEDRAGVDRAGCGVRSCVGGGADLVAGGAVGRRFAHWPTNGS